MAAMTSCENTQLISFSELQDEENIGTLNVHELF